MIALELEYMFYWEWMHYRGMERRKWFISGRIVNHAANGSPWWCYSGYIRILGFAIRGWIQWHRQLES